MPSFALHGHRAAGAAHDAVNDGKTESGALTHRLRREERIEDAFHDIRAHAAAVVSNGQSCVTAGRKLRDVVERAGDGFGIDVDARELDFDAVHCEARWHARHWWRGSAGSDGSASRPPRRSAPALATFARSSTLVRQGRARELQRFVDDRAQ